MTIQVLTCVDRSDNAIMPLGTFIFYLIQTSDQAAPKIAQLTYRVGYSGCSYVILILSFVQNNYWNLVVVS